MELVFRDIIAYDKVLLKRGRNKIRENRELICVLMNCALYLEHSEGGGTIKQSLIENFHFMPYVVNKLTRKKEKIRKILWDMNKRRCRLCDMVPYYQKEEKLIERFTNRESEVANLKNSVITSDFPLAYFKWKYLI